MKNFIFALSLTIWTTSAFAQATTAEMLSCSPTTANAPFDPIYKLVCSKELSAFKECSMEVSLSSDPSQIVKQISFEIVKETKTVISLINKTEQIQIEVTTDPTLTAIVLLPDGTSLKCEGGFTGGGTSVGN